MSLGPVEVTVLSFPGSQFNGQVAPALRRVVERGDIRVIDLVFLSRDEDGTLVSTEVADLADDDLNVVDAIVEDIAGLISEDDIDLIAEEIGPGSSAAVLVFEHAWARELADAIAGSGGHVVMNERIPRDIVQAAVDALAEDAELDAADD